jgi:hypothetical protein
MVKVTVPGPDYRASSAETAIWDAFGAFIELSRHAVRLGALDDDGAVFTVLLSRLSREMRREYGLEEAKAAFQGIADTMEQVAHYDNPSA